MVIAGYAAVEPAPRARLSAVSAKWPCERVGPHRGLRAGRVRDHPAGPADRGGRPPQRDGGRRLQSRIGFARVPVAAVTTEDARGATARRSARPRPAGGARPAPGPQRPQRHPRRRRARRRLTRRGPVGPCLGGSAGHRGGRRATLAAAHAGRYAQAISAEGRATPSVPAVPEVPAVRPRRQRRGRSRARLRSYPRRLSSRAQLDASTPATR